MSIKELSLKKNIIYAFNAQIITLAVNFMLTFIVAKKLELTQYSYWQLFSFYSGYAGLFHLGLNDGIYLKYGGATYENINKQRIGSQLWIGIIYQTALASILSFSAQFFLEDKYRLIIISISCYYAIFINATCFIGYFFQAVNLTNIYSISIIIDQLLFALFICFLIYFNIDSFMYYVLAFLTAKTIRMLYTLFYGRYLLHVTIYNIKSNLFEAFDSIKVGLNLTLANITENLIVGIGKFLVDYSWGLEAFGKISLSLSLTQLLIVFISQVGMVIYPNIRRNNVNVHLQYIKLKRILFSVLPGLILFGIPLKTALTHYMPSYKESMNFLILILPICVFNGLLVLANTFLKAYRKERELLFVNITSLICSVIINGVTVLLFHNLNIVVIGIVVVMAIKFLLSFKEISKCMNRNEMYDVLLVVALMTLFEIMQFGYNRYMYVYILVYALYIIIINRNNNIKEK